MRAGFSLVELSIVLVILGLLTGGILGGQSLIKAAELRSIETENQQWQVAVNTFKQKYFYYPGDIPNAERFWGSASSCPPVQGSTVQQGVCNGNGNGLIGAHAIPTGSEVYEMYMFWLELSKAGLIPGTYSGASEADDIYHAVIGKNVPASKYSGGGWTIRWRSDIPAGNDTWFAGDYGNAYVFGAQSTTITHDPILTPEEAWSIDTKYDDGKPGKGKIMIRGWKKCTLAANNQDFDAEYNLQSNSVACALNFRSMH